VRSLFNFGSFLAFLRNNKGYTAINVFGLSVSLMFVILIAVYVQQELSTDRFHKNAERIYVLGNEEYLASAGRIGYALQEPFPEIEKVCPVVSSFTNMTASTAEANHKASIFFADSCFFDFFSFTLTDGQASQVLEAQDYAVISETFAQKAFPGRNPVGQQLRLSDSVFVTINGVMKDFRHSVIPYADVLLRIESLKYYNPGIISPSYSNVGSASIFLLAKEGNALANKTDAMLAYFKEFFWIYKNGVQEKVCLTPLRDIYFSTLPANDLRQGDKSFVLIFLSVGLLILIFAIINYINLTVAQSGFRAKEMATRRLLGSSRKELFVRLISESSLMALLSFGLGLLLAHTALPFAGQLLDRSLYLESLFSPTNICLALLLILTIGFLSGLLPAILISKYNPIDVVRGSFRQKTKMVFSKVFITFQNAITIALMAAALIMITQVNHLIHAPLNYNHSNIIDIDLEFQFNDEASVAAFKSELSQLASVKRVGYTQGTPFNRGNNYTVNYPQTGKNISFQAFISDQAVFDMLQLKKLRENNIASEGYYLNQQAFKELEISEDTPSFPMWGREILIAGTLEDYRLSNISSWKAPVLYQIQKPEDFFPWSILVEVQGPAYQAYNEVKAVFERLTGLPFSGKFMDEQIRESYDAQYRTGLIVSIFTGIAMLISLLGLLAMSTYFIQQRAREIAVRKVFGSSLSQVLNKLILSFLNYVLLAFVLVTPVIGYLMHNWLSNYNYRISLRPGYFIAAGGFCLAISFVTVFFQSWRAANDNPVRRLKQE
jgi:ABC-type antimicrobial peptide transport system, permease component